MDREYAVEYRDGNIETTERGTLDEALAALKWSAEYEPVWYGVGKIVVRDYPEGAWIDAGL